MVDRDYGGGIFNLIKKEILDYVTSSIKKQIKINQKRVQKEIFNYFERQITLKIKRELRRYLFLSLFLLFIVIGSFTIFYGVIEVLLTFLGINGVFTNIIFGGILIILSLGFYLLSFN